MALRLFGGALRHRHDGPFDCIVGHKVAVTAVVIRLEGFQPNLAADIIPAGDRIVTRKRMHDKAFRRSGVELHTEASIFCVVARSRSHHRVALSDNATETLSPDLQTWKLCCHFLKLSVSGWLRV
jgi:hypothetical protein